MITRKKPDFVSFRLKDGIEPDQPRLAHIVLDGVAIINTYIPQGFLIDSPKYDIKLNWFKRFHEYLKKNFKPEDKLVWTGDVNVAPRAIDVHHPEKHLNHVCHHVDARRAYEKVLDFGLEDVFIKLHPDKQQFTFWDYRVRPTGLSALDANLGWRIDHILATQPMADVVKAVEVDLAPRRRIDASDHTILWAEFELEPPNR
jgi:exodeoxyribonuclease-3